VIPTEKQAASGAYKLVDGTWHKRCRGVAHEEPVWLPATDKFFYVRGGQGGSTSPGVLFSQCRLCCAWKKVKSPGSNHGYVPQRDVVAIFSEAVNRIGLKELAQRSGVSESFLRGVLYRRKTSVQKAKVRLVVLELVSIRRKNEHSISNGARRFAAGRNNNGVETCRGCGTPLANYTDGCGTCVDRAAKRRAKVGS
jgi:hypothetical protein